jgi:hypothetical protein
LDLRRPEGTERGKTNPTRPGNRNRPRLETRCLAVTTSRKSRSVSLETIPRFRDLGRPLGALRRIRRAQPAPWMRVVFLNDHRIDFAGRFLDTLSRFV